VAGDSLLRREALLEEAHAERLVGHVSSAQETLKTLREELAEEPDSAISRLMHLETALMAERQGDIAKAEKIRRQQLATSSGDYRFLEALGRLLQTNERSGEAGPWLRSAAAQRRRLSIAHAQSVQPRPEDEAPRRHRMATCYLECGMFEDATSWLRSVLCYAPNHKQAQRDLAEITRTSGAP